jgi:hypothetical protein
MLAISGVMHSCSCRSSSPPQPLSPVIGSTTTQPIASDTYANIAAGVRKEFGESTDAIEAAAKAGEPDYLAIVASAMSLDRQSMHRLLRLTARREFTGPAMIDHAEVLATLLPDVGDRFFASCLSAEDAAIQRQVRREIVANFARDDKGNLTQEQKEARALEDLRGIFPRTFPGS